MEGSFHICFNRKFLNEPKCVLYQIFGIFEVDVEAVEKLVSIYSSSTFRSRAWVLGHFHRQKCSHEGQPSPLKFLFLNLFSYTQTVSLKKMVKNSYCRVKSTRRGFKVRRLHNDFLARFWGRGKGLRNMGVWSEETNRPMNHLVSR